MKRGEIVLFNERLKDIRTKKELTQEEFAKLLNISPSSISLYESGSREPSLTTLINIAKILNVSTDYLLGLSDNEQVVRINISSKDKQEIVKKLLEIINKEEK